MYAPLVKGPGCDLKVPPWLTSAMPFIDKVNALDKIKSNGSIPKLEVEIATACAAMADLGFKELYNLQGGYDACKTQQ